MDTKSSLKLLSGAAIALIMSGTTASAQQQPEPVTTDERIVIVDPCELTVMAILA